MPNVRFTPYHVVFNGGFTGENSPGGQVYYVAASGYTAVNGIGASDSNNGKSPQQPFSTIQAGLDACTAGRGDTVALLPGSWTVTAALTMTKDDVTLKSAIPVGPRERGPAVIVNATDVNTLAIDANDCAVAGIVFDDNVATATADTAVIAVNTASTATDYTGTKIINCYLDMAGADSDRDGITLGLAGDATDGALNSLVEGCTIWDCNQDAIVIAAGSEYSTVRNCHIHDDGTILTRYGVEVVALSCTVEDCDISVSDTATPGACIHNGLAASRLEAYRNTLHAWGADGTCILAIATATQRTADNWMTAVAAGNLVDYITDNTSPSADANVQAVFAADSPKADFDTPTDDGA